MSQTTWWIVLAQAGGGDGGSGLMSNFLLFVAIIVFAFYFIIIRPQRREQVTRERVLASLAKGTKVITAGGIHGTVATASKGSETVEVEVAKGVRMTFNRSSISVINPGKDAKEAAEKAPDKKGKTSGGEKEEPAEESAPTDAEEVSASGKVRTPPPRKGKRK